MGRQSKAQFDNTSTWPKVSQKHPKSEYIHSDQIILVSDCLTRTECKQFIDTAESIGFEHQGSRGAAYGEAYRDNHRIQCNDPKLAMMLWQSTGIKDIISKIQLPGMEPIGLNSNIRIYRYSKGQRFGRHIDESNVLESGITAYTLLIYLSDPIGGETIFYDHKGKRVIASVAPKAGLALLHRHGDECLEHEGAAVTSGVKYVLRSDVVYSI